MGVCDDGAGSPGLGSMRELEGRAEALAGTFNDAGRGKHAVGVCDDGAGSPGLGLMRDAGGAGGGAGGHV